MQGSLKFPNPDQLLLEISDAWSFRRLVFDSLPTSHHWLILILDNNRSPRPQLLVWDVMWLSIHWEEQSTNDILFYLHEKKKNYAGSATVTWKPLPTLIRRKRSHFGTEYRKAPPPRKGKEKGKEKGQWGSGRAQAWPETGSWWELITVLERARLVWTNLAAKSTGCTWSLEASFLTLWESRPSSLKTSECECYRWCRPHPKGWCGEQRRLLGECCKGLCAAPLRSMTTLSCLCWRGIFMVWRGIFTLVPNTKRDTELAKRALLAEKREKHLGRWHPYLPTKTELATQKGAGETDTMEPHKTGRNRPRAEVAEVKESNGLKLSCQLSKAQA